MNIQSSTVRRALLSIYAQHRKLKGSGLSVRQLEREWHDTGLRRSDLRAAIQDLLQRQWLLEIEYEDGDERRTLYSLTYLGECATHDVFRDGLLTTMSDWWSLRNTRKRVSHQPPTPPEQVRNRRVSDGTSPPRDAH